MWRSTRIIRCGESMIRKLADCVDRKLQNEYTYKLKKVERDLKEITDVYVQQSSDMEALIKLKSEGKWSTITNVVYQINSLQGEELEKVENMAKKAGLNMKPVPDWFEPEPEEGKRANPGYVPKPGGYEPADVGEGSGSVEGGEGSTHED